MIKVRSAVVSTFDWYITYLSWYLNKQDNRTELRRAGVREPGQLQGVLFLLISIPIAVASTPFVLVFLCYALVLSGGIEIVMWIAYRHQARKKRR